MEHIKNSILNLVGCGPKIDTKDTDVINSANNLKDHEIMAPIKALLDKAWLHDSQITANDLVKVLVDAKPQPIQDNNDNNKQLDLIRNKLAVSTGLPADSNEISNLLGRFAYVNKDVLVLHMPGCSVLDRLQKLDKSQLQPPLKMKLDSLATCNDATEAKELLKSLDSEIKEISAKVPDQNERHGLIQKYFDAALKGSKAFLQEFYKQYTDERNTKPPHDRPFKTFCNLLGLKPMADAQTYIHLRENNLRTIKAAPADAPPRYAQFDEVTYSKGSKKEAMVAGTQGIVTNKVATNRHNQAIKIVEKTYEKDQDAQNYDGGNTLMTEIIRKGNKIGPLKNKDGTPIADKLLMKHLNGIELTTAFTELRANPAQLKQVVSDFFTSIQDLHNHINVHGEEKHFSHGDIKPANTVMVKEGGMLQWNIIDNDNLVNETDVLPGQTAATSSQETLDNGKGVLIDDYYSCLKTLGAVMRGAEHNNPKFQIKDADVNYITQMATRFFNLAPGDTKTFHDFIQKKGGTIADDNELRNAALLIIEKTFI